MPFTSLADPIQLAMAGDALHIAWEKVRTEVSPEDYRRELTKLAYIVAGFAPMAIDRQHLIDNALVLFQQSLVATAEVPAGV